MFPGVVAANTVVVTGVLSLVLMLDIWGGVEKPGGGVISLPLIIGWDEPSIKKPVMVGVVPRFKGWIARTVTRSSTLAGKLRGRGEIVVTPPMLQLIPTVLAKPSSLPLNQNPSNFIFLKLRLGKIKVINCSLVVLSGTRRANCVYTLDSQAVTMKTLKGRKQLGEYQTGWKIKKGNVLDSCNDMSTQQCTNSGVTKHLGVVVLQQ
ncbi:hypothetical protein Tco_0908174 [Tanacetum coccineum]|uniref:Uncharacterized protein n=1 Tax=Tanacetum coccineum TaxID=301880 RepID=A0ABQ5CST8_9ASTR